MTDHKPHDDGKQGGRSSSNPTHSGREAAEGIYGVKKGGVPHTPSSEALEAQKNERQSGSGGQGGAPKQ